MELKRCSRCRNEYPATAEYFSYSKRDGFLAQCKECRKAAYNGRMYAKRKERYAADVAYRERCLASSKAAWEKYAVRYRALQLKYRNCEEVRRLMRARSRSWQIAHPDRVRVNVQNRRARLAGALGTYTEDEVLFLLHQQGNRCHYCGCDVSGGRHTVDHLVPISKGGSNWPENLVISCARCNAVKGAKLPHEFNSYLEMKGSNHG